MDLVCYSSITFFTLLQKFEYDIFLNYGLLEFFNWLFLLNFGGSYKQIE